MIFSNLYKDNRESVERALRAMWCGETGNESQRKYSEKLRQVIKEIFAPKDAVPVVQCMNSYEAVKSVSAAEAKALVGPLWTSTKFNPYEHQYQCWRTLLKDKSPNGKPMSICVTTGTGSGKTECFMMPLVKDLTDQKKSDQIQALFLYPLNALMEDQKERLEELLEGTHLTYTVYNGDLPDFEPKDTDSSAEADRLRKRIRQIRGWDEKKGEYKFKHMIYTREQVRKNPPNILLTNPTMLEYILLRGKDATLTNPSLKSLSWIAIDETHTYTGAGAAELAMLLRRIQLAFGVKAEDLHFATSSATFGNGSNPEEEERRLREFIAGVTGVHESQVRVVGGRRVGEDHIPENEDKERWKLLIHKDFIRLDELFPASEQTTEQKLALLDDMCSRIPIDNGIPAMKAKVHFFYRVPNNGLFVKLTEHEDGAFNIYTKNSIEDDSKETPLLELSRCKHCGEYVALAKVNTTPGDDFGKYQALDRDESDMFDLEENDEDDGPMKYAIIGLSRQGNAKGDNNIIIKLENGKVTPVNGDVDENEWHLVSNTHCCCPYCNSKLTKKRDNDEEDSADSTENMENAYLQKFRTSADFVSRIMAPFILNHLEKGVSKKDRIVLHDGQQYISFADSRQMAAKATLKQNIDQERLWLYSTIFHELCKRKAESGKVSKQILDLQAQLMVSVSDMDKSMEILKQIQVLQQKQNDYISWMEIANLLRNDEYCKVFCDQFIKRSGDSDELDQDGNIPAMILDKYVQSIMVMYLSSRPSSAAAPETMGLFHSCYPQMGNIDLPASIKQFNESLQNEGNRINKKDWQNLLQVFMDYTVRSNQSLFLKISDTNPIDIFASERFATEKPRRRPTMKPKFERGKSNQGRLVRYLCGLFIREDNTLKESDVMRMHFDEISKVVEAFWEELNKPDNLLLEESVRWDNDSSQYIKDRDHAIRFNLINLSFKLYENVYLCDTNTDSATRHTQCLRPIENNFKGFAPYLSGNHVVSLNEEWHEVWEPYPFFKGCGKNVSYQDVNEWAKKNRKILWNNHIWGDEGVFSNRLTDIHMMPNLFIQAEHTAQVDKDVSRTLQSNFKDHTINIMACSTTMEMGVDLGNLEVVMLSSVPPQPANYKQRAGRSGRNNKVCSVCITLCGSDAVGLRTLFNPIENIISRPVRVPMVDLMSPQVVQRHVNSYLVRTFGVFTDGGNGGKLTQKVLDYYTTFVERKEGKFTTITDPITGADKLPIDKLGDEKDSMYALFNLKCSQALGDAVHEDLVELLRGTVFEGHPEYVVAKARENNERCYQELNDKLEDYSIVFGGDIADKFRTKLKMQYMEVLNQRLLNFWATSRFTPNANMPVNVLTLDLSSSSKKDYSKPTTSSNPSYGLRDAIAQYAPGNNIVVDGVAYIVRGIEFSNMYQGVKAFKQIYRNSDKCVIDDPTLDSKLRWGVNEKDSLELIQPVGFLPDMNEDKSRIMETNRFTRVSAQLIGTADWDNNVTEPHLFSVRSNRETGYAKILYYNEGLGYGYCLCTRCGRMVLESGVADGESTLDKMPEEMNPKRSKVEGKPHYHAAIAGKELHKGCGGSNDKDSIRRNVIIGDLVQTDYAEIRIRHKGAKKWMNSRTEENLLFTLGIVFTQSLLELLGKERGAVDFAIMPNGHICLFDTNPGGAGYANQMASVPLMKDILASSKQMLEVAKLRNSKDLLLDKFTLRFISYIDIDAALAWIQEEEESQGILPENVAFVSPKSTETDIVSLQRAFSASSSESIIFVNNNYDVWNYDDEEHGWRGHFLNHFNTHDGMVSLCVVDSEKRVMPEPALNMLRSVKSGWAKDVKHIATPYANKDIYPIAYIDGVLYFTNNVEYSGLNDVWGNMTLFCARVSNISVDAVPIDCGYKENTKIFMFTGDEVLSVKSSELGNYIQDYSEGIIDKFINYCKSKGGKIKVSYQDEHLKSVMGILITLQTIGHIIKQIGADFELEFLVEKYEDEHCKYKIQSNLKDSAERNMRLGDLTNGWLCDIDNEFSIHGELNPIKSHERNSLTHWRVLSFECGDKTLSIYPDGGFANGWDIGKNSKYFTLDNTDSRDCIALERSKDIKYDVTVSDNNK